MPDVNDTQDSLNLTRAELLTRLQCAAVGEPSTAWSCLTQLLIERFSCRGFLPARVPHETIERVIAAAQLAASWCNSQPWQLIVTEGNGTERFRQALYAYADANPPMVPDYAFPERYTGVYDLRRKEAGWTLYGSVGVTRGDRAASHRQAMENFRLFGAPHVCILTTERDLGVYGCIDCGIFAANLMVLMQSIGLATIAQAALAGYASFVRSYFDIPANRQILFGISFGYADPAHAANSFRTRRSDATQEVSWVSG